MTGKSSKILVGIGANLPTAEYKTPRETCGAALATLDSAHDIAVTACSNWYESAPVPISDQPWFVNAVAQVKTSISAGDLMQRLLEVENQFGRQRSVKNAPRILDLDLLAYADFVLSGDPVVPHPRLHQRAFAVLPIRDLAPDWIHPLSGDTVQDLCDALPNGQEIRLMPPSNGYFGTEWHPPASP